jgi:hypothetical protein
MPLAERATVNAAYSPPGVAGAFQDQVECTVVMINLGNAVYRQADIPGGWDRGHAALVVGYTGQCTHADLTEDSNFLLIEMDGPTDNKTLDTITQADQLVPMGCYTKPTITLEQRLKVILTARALVNRAPHIAYCLEDALLPEPWNGTVPGVNKLRCDGLIEMCYEMNGIMVWGAIEGGPPGYGITQPTFQEQHNRFGWVIWQDTLQPATQCAYENEYWTDLWDTTFQMQYLCEPLGSTGGSW